MFEAAVTIASFLLCLAPVPRLFRAGGIFLPSYVIFAALFVPGLHLANISAGEWDDLPYLASHAAWILHLWLLSAIALHRPRIFLADAHWLDKARATKDHWLSALFALWVVFKLYLLANYGLLAFRVAWQEIEGLELDFERFNWWQTALDRYITLLAVGASAIWVVKAFVSEGYARRAKKKVLLPFLVFLIPFLVAQESPIGTRRYVIALVLLGFTAHLQQSKTPIVEFVRGNWRRFTAVLILVVAFSAYYQSVRNNLFNREIESLASESPTDVVLGIATALIPRFEEDEALDADRSVVNRDGPFVLTYEVMNKLINGHPGTQGEIVSNALQMLIPRVVIGDAKSDVNTDDIIAYQMSITPRGDFSTNDMATNIVATSFADQGLLGLLFAPIFTAIAFGILAATSRLRVVSSAPWTFVLCAMLLNFAGGVESDILAILADLRNLLFLLPLAGAIAWTASLRPTSQPCSVTDP